MNPSVVLEPEEMLCAKLIGALRFDASKDLPDKWGASKDEWTDVEAAAAEEAFAKWRQLYWPGKVNRPAPAADPDRYKDPDVGPFQVRWTHHDNGRLRVTPKDKDGDPFVLVTGKNGAYCIRGWLWGHEAKRDEWWTDFGQTGREKVWGVPQKDLRPAVSILSWDPADEADFIEMAKAAFPTATEEAA